MITFDHLRMALSLPDFDGLMAQAGMAPTTAPMRMLGPPAGAPPARQAGVLVLVYPQQDDLRVILTRRTEHLRGHSGQISFPGGQRDPHDVTFAQTALRETCEELGLCDPDLLTVVGQLTRVYILPSNFDVHPVVAIAPYEPSLTPNPDEVAEVFSLRLADLLSPRLKHRETRIFRDQPIDVPYYLVEGHKVWGATAAMLSELEARLRRVLAPDVLAHLD